jgi:type IV secretory pathway VirB2 component (pilin)
VDREHPDRDREMFRIPMMNGRRIVRCSGRTMMTSSARTRTRYVARLTAIALAIMALPWTCFAQSPWERAASNLETTFTGPLARSLALVAIVIGGLMFMYGEGGAKRQVSGIVFGGGLALFATQFLAWLF